MIDVDFSTVEDGVGLLTLNRPEKRNAVSPAMLAALLEVLTASDLIQQRAVVVAGAGPSFCAGVDLSSLGEARDPTAASRLFTALRRCPPVLVAAVHGYALGLGSGLAMACDLVIAGEDAVFGYPEIGHNLVAGVTMVGLREVAGQRRALDLLVTGRRVPAAEALAIGMVTEVVPTEQLRARALDLARGIAQHATSAVHMTRRLFHETASLPYEQAVEAGERAVHAARVQRAEERNDRAVA